MKRWIPAVLFVVLTLLLLSGSSLAYNEAPMLKERVDQGDLPPVDRRLPQEPMIVAPFEEIGEYGGTWRRIFYGPADFHAYGRTVYEPILRWARNPADGVVANIAQGWEFAEDGKELHVYLREGHKWSDGHPFTVDDIIFWWEDIALNPELNAGPPSVWVVGSEPMQLTKLSDTHLLVEFAVPHGLAEELLAFQGNQWPLSFERFGFFAPKHYLKQFHPKYNDEYTNYEVFEEKADDFNTDRPVLTAWTVKELRHGERLVAERNPYYYKVDPEGNQLPYIDRIVLSVVENPEVANLRAVAGEVDMQLRHLSIENYSLFVENQDLGDYRVIDWSSAVGADPLLMPNWNHKDPVLREIIRELDFRIALSLAIDRDLINDIAYLGLGEPRQAALHPSSRFYLPEQAERYAEYDPDRANRLLDGLGLERGTDGIRRRPDGKPLALIIDVSAPTSQPRLDSLELIQEMWGDIGIDVSINPIERSLFWIRTFDGEHDIAVWGMDRGTEPLVDPIWLAPVRGHSWYAPLYGKWYETGGKEGVEPTGDHKRALELYDQIKVTVDPEEKVRLTHEMIRIHSKNVWTIGIVGLLPDPGVVKNNFRNVPEEGISDWIIMAPGYTHPEQYFIRSSQ